MDATTDFCIDGQIRNCCDVCLADSCTLTSQKAKNQEMTDALTVEEYAVSQGKEDTSYLPTMYA